MRSRRQLLDTARSGNVQCNSSSPVSTTSSHQERKDWRSTGITRRPNRVTQPRRITWANPIATGGPSSGTYAKRSTGFNLPRTRMTRMPSFHSGACCFMAKELNEIARVRWPGTGRPPSSETIAQCRTSVICIVVVTSSKRAGRWRFAGTQRRRPEETLRRCIGSVASMGVKTLSRKSKEGSPLADPGGRSRRRPVSMRARCVLCQRKWRQSRRGHWRCLVSSQRGKVTSGLLISWAYATETVQAYDETSGWPAIGSRRPPRGK